MPYQKSCTIRPEETDHRGELKLSALLHLVQQVSGDHCDALGLSWDRLAEKGLFWAVIRHRAEIVRLPRVGETVTLQTWPVAQTRTAYPRAVRVLDGNGNMLFQVASLWVLMDMQSRSMVLPGKSGITVPGETMENSPAMPQSLHPCQGQHSVLWTVGREDLDINGHVNNAMYLEHTEALLGKEPLRPAPRELTVCYLAENRLGQIVSLEYNLSPEGVLTVDGFRQRTDVPDGKERVYAARIVFC